MIDLIEDRYCTFLISKKLYICKMNNIFDINQYLGRWYELAHYPSWFQRNDNYNTEAYYTLNNDGTIAVRNSTMLNGLQITSYGIAHVLSGAGRLNVDFSPPEVNKVVSTFGETTQNNYITDPNVANYVIDMIFTNLYGQYIFAIVTNDSKDSLFVLSRYPNPSLTAYNQIMAYITEHYDSKRMVQTPHFN
jgi:apolipoprotein D and lipocalin family protein